MFQYKNIHIYTYILRKVSLNVRWDFRDTSFNCSTIETIGTSTIETNVHKVSSLVSVVVQLKQLVLVLLKLVSLDKSHRTFNETCLNNDLLPTYTDIYIHVFFYLDMHECLAVEVGQHKSWEVGEHNQLIVQTYIVFV